MTASDDDNTAKVWNLSGKELATLSGHDDKLNSVVFSPDGSKIVTTSDDNTVKVWKLSGKVLTTLGGLFRHRLKTQ